MDGCTCVPGVTEGRYGSARMADGKQCGAVGVDGTECEAKDVDRQSPGTDRLVSAEPCAVQGALRSDQRRRVLPAADRTATSDCLLRGPSAGLQLQHAGEAWAGPAGHRRSPRNAVRSRHRSARIGGTRGGRGARAIEGDGPRARRSSSSPRRPTGACSMRWSTRTSNDRAIRCSIAPKPLSRSSSTKRCIRKRCCTCGIGWRSMRNGGRQGMPPPVDGAVPRQEWIRVPAGRATSASTATI